MAIKSDVEVFYEKCCGVANQSRPFKELSGHEQMILVQALNMIQAVVFNAVQVDQSAQVFNF